jgi:hypothetical protein
VSAEEGDENNQKHSTNIMSPKRPAGTHQWPRRAIQRDLFNPHTVIMPWRLSEAWQWGSGVGVGEGDQQSSTARAHGNISYTRVPPLHPMPSKQHIHPSG